MATRETRRQRGRRRGKEMVRAVVSELRQQRQTANLSQRAVAAELGWHQSALNRLERFDFENVPLVRLAEIAAVLGLELSIRLHLVGDPTYDEASQGLIGRFLRVVSASYRVTREALLPSGGQRSWDVLLRLASLLVGVELVTRVRDVQALVRLIRPRARRRRGPCAPGPFRQRPQPSIARAADGGTRTAFHDTTAADPSSTAPGSAGAWVGRPAYVGALLGGLTSQGDQTSAWHPARRGCGVRSATDVRGFGRAEMPTLR